MSLLYPLTFLDMLQRVHLETGTSGASPSSVTGQPDQITRLAMWLSTAWMTLQNTHTDWSYLRASATFPTVDGQPTYPVTFLPNSGAAFGKWKLDTARVYLTASGLPDEFPIGEIDYDAWRDQYLLGSLRDVRTRPIVIADSPINHDLCLGPVPNANYTVELDYFLSAQPLLMDTDTPSTVLTAAKGAVSTIVPVQWNMVMIYMAMMDYGSYESAPEVYTRGESGEKRLLSQMGLSELPRVRVGGPMA